MTVSSLDKIRFHTVNLLGKEIYVNIAIYATGILTVRCFMLIGYARVSTGDQSLNLEKDALSDLHCKPIIEDRLECRKRRLPWPWRGARVCKDWRRSCRLARFDRLTRSIKDLIEMVVLLESKGIRLRNLHEAIDTSSSYGKLVF